MRVAVYGLWHLGCVTAACLAEAGFDVVGLDPDPAVIAGLREGRAPLFEPGLDPLIAEGVRADRLRFTSDPADAAADVFWVTFDTPVDENDRADVAFVRARLEEALPALRPGTLVLISAQVPAGFTRALERDWSGRALRFAVSPENLRLGKALDAFRRPERVVIGVRDPADRPVLEELFRPFCSRIEWMGVESAEITKHALNAFLATSVTFINEVARLCEVLGGDAKEVERGLKSEPRIGPRAYLGPGAAFAGGTLARDLRYLESFGAAHGVATPLVAGVLASNAAHQDWLRTAVSRALVGVEAPCVAVLGLAYRPGTSTLRRSSALELCAWLAGQGVSVAAHDPAVPMDAAEVTAVARRAASALDALEGADLAVVATEWPDYRSLTAEALARTMRRAVVIDQSFFLAAALSADPHVRYVAPGRLSGGSA